MKAIFPLLFLAFVGACQTNDKKTATENTKAQSTSSADTSNSTNQQPICKKCDTAIITTVSKHWNNLTNSQLEEFLCSFDKSCDKNLKYKGDRGTYSGAAYEMLVVELDIRLAECIKLIDVNKNINFSYLLSLLTNTPIKDLPYQSIISQLENRSRRTETEKKILDTLKERMRS